MTAGIVTFMHIIKYKPVQMLLTIFRSYVIKKLNIKNRYNFTQNTDLKEIPLTTVLFFDSL